MNNKYERPSPDRGLISFAIICVFSWAAVVGQDGPDQQKILNLLEEKTGPHSLSVDWGGPGLWQRLLKLRTTASVLYTTAHPDDEQGGTLTLLSRGKGVRTSLLTLNRGESGANAIGSELFDGLGLIRTEELLVSGRYYGLDDQYFTTVVDYGYSKTLDETLGKWGRENVLRDVVRVIRINRPLVLISRFFGGGRDGHGNHQTAGLVSQEAFEAAGDPQRFPEQISQEGLRAWQPLKMYRSNLRSRRFFGGSPQPPDQRWNVRTNVGEFGPWLGQSYQEFSSLGLSFQRSQTSGRRRESAGSHYQFFERLHSRIDGPESETGFFAGIDTSITGMFDVLDIPPQAEALELLSAIESHVDAAFAAFNIQNPSSTVPFLVLGLERTREAIRIANDPDVRFMLKIKERQFQDAINTALGMSFRATAVPPGTGESASPFAPAATMGAVVPGQSFQVGTTLVNPSDLAIRAEAVRLWGPADWQVHGNSGETKSIRSGETIATSFEVATPSQGPLSGRYFRRASIQESRYEVRESEFLHLPARKPALTATADYTIGGQRISVHAVVHRREANLPYGYELRELKIVPALGVNINPASLIVPLSSGRKTLSVKVEVLNNKTGGISGELALDVPEGWRVQPSSHPVKFEQAGERRAFSFSVTAPRLSAESYKVGAVARAEGREYREGYDTIRHRDYDIKYLYRDAVAQVRGVDVKLRSNLQVGYVMGVGDEVPAGIEQLGAEVSLLDSEDLASGDLNRFDSIVVGTRAYAVRQDLITYNQRLIDYARQGGNLIILYQTQEFIPNKWAAHPAELPRRAEEVSEEDSPVTILAPDHPAFKKPNQITQADFDNWVEQRGSKFFSQWESDYVAMIETQDQGQEPQRGGWLIARVGDGYYTYFAYAVHRQFPYGVSGAYRIFANLLSLNKQ